MSSSEERTEELTDRLVLDVKALVLLHGSESDLKERLDRALVDSADESLARFVKALQRAERPAARGLILMSLGELVLASLLVLAGTIVLLPNFLGIGSPTDLIRYLTENALGGIGNSPLGPYASLIAFALGALLMLAAFYTLRQAALNLKESGLSVKPED